jgi:hypothetical protein
MEATGLVCARFVDDWVILAPTRYKLREAIHPVNERSAEPKLEQHPDKTFIGWVCRGFDSLGDLFRRVCVAPVITPLACQSEGDSTGASQPGQDDG